MPAFRFSLRSLTVAVAVVLAVTTSLAGCGSSSGSGSSGKPVSVLKITIKGDRVEPENKRVLVSLKKGITLQIDSDRAGELHVHSSPEQQIDFEAGATTKRLTFQVPGVIELEEHHSDALIAQLEVK